MIFMTNKQASNQTTKTNEGVMTMTHQSNHPTHEELTFKKELETIQLINQIDVDDYQFKALRNYAIAQVEAKNTTSLEDATMNMVLIGEQEELVSDIFFIDLEGYGYHGMIHEIGKVNDKMGYRVMFVDSETSYPIICNHDGLGKLFDYCEDHQGIFFIDSYMDPIEHLVFLADLQEELNHQVYGYYDFDEYEPLSPVIVTETDVLIGKKRCAVDDHQAFEEAIADMIFLSKVKENPEVEHFGMIMDLIEIHEAEQIFDYYGINPFCGCQLAEIVESFEEKPEEWMVFAKHALMDHIEALENGWCDEDEIVDHAFYFSTYLRVEPITLEEVKKLAEALFTYLKWLYEVELKFETKKVA